MQYHCTYPGDTSWTFAPERIMAYDESIPGCSPITARQTSDQQVCGKDSSFEAFPRHVHKQYLANVVKHVWSINPFYRSNNVDYSVAVADGNFQYDGLPACQWPFGISGYYNHDSLHERSTACHPSKFKRGSDELGGSMVNDIGAGTSCRSDVSTSFTTEHMASSFDGASSPSTTRSDCWSELSSHGTSSEISPVSTFRQWAGGSAQLTQRLPLLPRYGEMTESFRVPHGQARQPYFPAITELSETMPGVSETIGSATIRAPARDNTNQAVKFQFVPTNATSVPIGVHCQDSSRHFSAASGPQPYVTAQVHNELAVSGAQAWNEITSIERSLPVHDVSFRRIQSPIAARRWAPSSPYAAEAAIPFKSSAGQYRDLVTSTTVVKQRRRPTAIDATPVKLGHSSPKQVSRHHESKLRRLHKSAKGNTELQSGSIHPSPNISRSTVVDEYLLRWKRAGKTYREIRENGNYTVAESTLRGRYRNMTKERYLRVRMPKWEDTDVSYSRTSAASQRLTGSFYQTG